LAQLALVAWFIAMTLVAATLLGRHLVGLPRPTQDAALAQAMESLRGLAGGGRWMAVHVLYADCLCSQRVADHLLASRRPEGLAERVLLIGHDAELESRFAATGISTTVVSEEQAGTVFHVVAAPSLVVVAPDGSVRYSGGYSARKQGADLRDVAIVAETRSGHDVAPLPILGCAVSARLRASLNPLGLP
jgi:hypothetical protein